jgi:hypothetical protein
MRRVLGAGYGLGWLVLVTLWLMGASSALIALGHLVDWTGWDRPPVDAIVSDAHALIVGLMWFAMLVCGLLLVPLAVLGVLFGPLGWLHAKLAPAPLPTQEGRPSKGLPDPHTWVYQTGYETFTGAWMVCEHCAHCGQERWRKD